MNTTDQSGRFLENKTSLLSTNNLQIGYRNGKTEKVIAQHLDLHLFSGQMFCLLGPNGAGKSTLMRTLAGLQPGLSGDVYIENQRLQELSPNDLAQRLSLVLTDKAETGNLTVEEVVTLGRTPYTNWLGTLSSEDSRQISLAMEAAQVSDFASKRLFQLSDGERQKVMLARALAQDTKIILLDEPTAHLDLPSRIEMMHLLRNLSRKSNKAILLSTHDLDLALQTADQLWLMKKGGETITGVPEDLVLNGSFEKTFARRGFYFDKSTGSFKLNAQSLIFDLYLEGDPDLIFWTKRALQREGIGVSTMENSDLKLSVSYVDQNPQWVLSSDRKLCKFHSMEQLLMELFRH